MLKKMLLTLFIFSVAGCVGTKEAKQTDIKAIEKNILIEYKKENSSSKAISKMISSIAEYATPVTLLVSSDAILKGNSKNKLEDATFLYLIGSIRANNDVKFFSSELSGNSAPNVLLSGMIYPLQQYIGKELVLHPEAYNNVVNRLKSWQGLYKITIDLIGIRQINHLLYL